MAAQLDDYQRAIITWAYLELAQGYAGRALELMSQDEAGQSQNKTAFFEPMGQAELLSWMAWQHLEEGPHVLGPSAHQSPRSSRSPCRCWLGPPPTPQLLEFALSQQATGMAAALAHLTAAQMPYAQTMSRLTLFYAAVVEGMAQGNLEALDWQTVATSLAGSAAHG